MKRALSLLFAFATFFLTLAAPAYALSAAYVQNCAYSPSGTGTGTSTPITCGSAPTVGNQFFVGLFLHTTSAVTITPPSGTWTLVDTCIGNGQTLAVYSHTITSADNSGNSFSWSWGATAYYSHINMVEMSSGGTVDVHGCAADASSTTATSASVTPTATNDVPIYFVAQSNTISAPSAGSEAGGSTGACTMRAAGNSGGIYLSTETCAATTSTSATTVSTTYGSAPSAGFETEVLFLKSAISLNNGLALTGAGGPHQSVSVLTNPGTHVQTVVYGWGYAGVSTSVSIATQALWTSYAYQGSYQSSYDSAGIKTIDYSNWNLCYPSDNPLSCYYELAPLTVCQSNASTYGYSSTNCTATYVSQAAENCSGSYVYDPHYGNGYLNAPYISTSNYAQIASDRTGTPPEDFVFSDDTGSNGGLTNGPACNNSTSYSSSLWVTQMEAAIGAVNVGKPLFLNLLNAYAVSLGPTDLAPIANNTNVVGAECENCYVKSGGTIDSATDWTNDEDACLMVQSYNKICWVYSNIGAVTASTASAQRLYAYASFLLTYGGSNSIFEYALSGLTDSMPIMPEEELVPTNPVESVGTDVTVLASGSGFIRHYTDCFYDGVDLGACMIAVNPSNSTSMTISTTGYTHALSIPTATATSDIVGGGTVSLTGTPSTTVAAQTAEIALP